MTFLEAARLAGTATAVATLQFNLCKNDVLDPKTFGKLALSYLSEAFLVTVTTCHENLRPLSPCTGCDVLRRLALNFCT